MRKLLNFIVLCLSPFLFMEDEDNVSDKEAKIFADCKLIGNVEAIHTDEKLFIMKLL
jgi:hypothetical protein